MICNGYRRPGFSAPLRIKSEWMHPIDPIWDEEKNCWRKRYRLFDPVHGMVITELLIELIDRDLVNVEPMKESAALALYDWNKGVKP